MTKETEEERRTRLSSVMAQLDAAKQGTFLDLCELVTMFAERTECMLKWSHPRGVVVHIKHKKSPGKAKGSRS